MVEKKTIVSMVNGREKIIIMDHRELEGGGRVEGKGIYTSCNH